MGLPVLVVVGALGAQGSSVVSAFASPGQETRYHIRALTSNTSSETAIALAAQPNVSVVSVDLNSVPSILSAFENAVLIFANTVFHPETFLAEGAIAAQLREQQQGLNIVHAASQIKTLQHLVWSTLPDASKIDDGKFQIPHFQSKIAAENFARSIESGLLTKTTYLRVGFYGSNIKMPPYRLIPVKTAKKYVMLFPCSPDAIFPFVGNERVNVGLIARAIFEQPKTTLGRVVLGSAEMLSCRHWADILARCSRRQGNELDVSYMECTLEAFESLWGAVGTEIGGMFTFFRDVEFGGYKGDTGSLPALMPRDLGIADTLQSTEDYLNDFDWQTLV